MKDLIIGVAAFVFILGCKNDPLSFGVSRFVLSAPMPDTKVQDYMLKFAITDNSLVGKSFRNSEDEKEEVEIVGTISPSSAEIEFKESNSKGHLSGSFKGIYYENNGEIKSITGTWTSGNGKIIIPNV